MPEHFLIKNVISLPEEALLRSTQMPERLICSSKSIATPSDDDDCNSSMTIYGRNNSFLTKTFAAPGDDDDYHSAMNSISGWNNSFLTKIKAAPGDDDDYHSAMNSMSGWNNLFLIKTEIAPEDGDCRDTNAVVTS